MDELDKVVELDLGCVPEAAVPAPLLIQGDDTPAFLIFNAYKKGVDGRLAYAGQAIAEFPLCGCIQFGYPNDEALPGHPLYSRGLSAYGYGIFEVINSSWKKRLREQNRVAFPDTKPGSSRRSSRHFIITFHDSTFECIADDIIITVSDESQEQLVAQVLKRIFHE